MKTKHVSQTAVFGCLVRDYMNGTPPTISRSTPCAEAVGVLRDRGASRAVITETDGRILGILTEHDVTHRITFGSTENTPVAEVMSSPVVTARASDYLFHAIAVMRRHNLQHLPVLDDTGRLIGMLHLHEALGSSMPTLLELIDRLTHEATLEGLKQLKAAQTEVAAAMLRDNIPTPDILALLTSINNDTYRRLLERHVTNLADEGWGNAPLEFEVIVMGSSGREENFLAPDQDNGFILADYPPSRHNSLDRYFIELAERMTQSLNAVGMPLCRGHVMATNPLWRKSLNQWCSQIDFWLRKPNFATLRFADIFFDFQCVYGEGRLSRHLRDYLSHRACKQHRFLQEMQRVQQGHGVALSPFKRLKTENKGPNKGKLNLKYQGLLPLVESIRLLSLRAGVRETSTLARIDVLNEQRVLDDNEQDYLAGAFRHISKLVLRQQIRDYYRRQPLGPYVSPKKLSRREKDMLIDSLKAVDDVRKRVDLEFTANLF